MLIYGTHRTARSKCGISQKSGNAVYLHSQHIQKGTPLPHPHTYTYPPTFFCFVFFKKSFFPSSPSRYFSHHLLFFSTVCVNYTKNYHLFLPSPPSFPSHFPPFLPYSITCVKWGGCGLIYTASQDTTVRVWRADDGVLCRTLLGHAHWINSLALNTDYVIRTGPYNEHGEIAGK